MKRCNLTLTGWQGAILILAIIFTSLVGTAYCRRSETTAVLVQKTPEQGGEVTPGVGVHYFDLNSKVILTAVPKPGYEFVYWLGDVTDHTTNRTVAYLDSPKIIIAVFEQIGYEFLALSDRSYSASAGGLMRKARDYSNTGGGGGGGRRNGGNGYDYKISYPLPVPKDGEEDEFPVPEEGEDEFPVPIPEPSTMLLLTLGSLTVLRGKSKKQTRTKR